MRAALYARFSDEDLQRAASIDDQMRDARRYAERLGAEVAAALQDDGKHGHDLESRPGLLALLALARARAVDVVIAENTDRLARRGSAIWAVYEDLTAWGVAIHTVQYGLVTTLTLGMASTNSVVESEKLAHRTRRGLEGVVEEGRSAGGLAYGYRVLRRYDAKGEPIRGLREIVPEEAEVVRRIFDLYAAGRSGLAIASALNAEGVPAPRGGPWQVSTIVGNAARGNGVIHNALYRGETVWGRQSWMKDRQSGRRRGRLAPADRLVRVQDEGLRIVSEELWGRVRARHAEASAAAGGGGRPQGARRPKRLLSGLIRCGLCGGPMTLTGPKSTLRCAARATQGPTGCANGRNPAYAGVEARVLAAVQSNLLHPAVVAAAVKAYADGRALARKAAAGRRQGVEKRLAEVRRRMGRLIEQVETGELTGGQVRARLEELEGREADLTREAEAARADAKREVTVIHPNAPAYYRQLIERLGPTLAPGEGGLGLLQAQAVDAFRRLVRAVIFNPLPHWGQYGLEIDGDLAPLLRLGEGGDYRPKMGAGTRTALGPSSAIPIRLAG